MKPTGEWIFGISLDKHIEWQLRELLQDASGIRVGPPCNLGGELKAPPDGFRGDLFNPLRRALEEFATANKTTCDMVKHVGISSIGLIDRLGGALTSIPRKDWGHPNCIVLDFKLLLNGIFDNITHQFEDREQTPSVVAHNDCTAKCLAEFELAWRTEEDPAESIFYAMFSEGVNAGFVHNHVPLLTELHTEMGHILPRPHPHDQKFNRSLSGCPIHHICFEGLAASKRFDLEWPEGLDESPTARDVFSFYIASMCYNGALIFSPQRLLVAGEHISDTLLPQIYRWFHLINSGGTDKDYLFYDGMERMRDFIRQPRINYRNAGIEGALELARLSKVSPALALRGAWEGYRPIRPGNVTPMYRKPLD